MWLLLSLFEKNELKITYLDVGQGDSSVIELPDGKTMVMDTGRTGMETASFLKYRGKKTVDVLILSHSHPDHAGGLDYILNRFTVRELWYSGRFVLPGTLNGETVRTLSRGDVVEGGGYSIHVLHPYPDFYTMNGNEYVAANNDSLLLKLECNGMSFLFTGDIEEEAETDILQLGRWLKSDVIKVPHHGGKTSSLRSFIDAVSPDIAVISAGRDNAFGHPHKETLDALQEVQVFRTDLDGATRLSKAAQGFKSSTYKNLRLEKARSFNDEMKNVRRLFVTW
jgi:competence protein ComEC